jgi:cellulose synthase/poly-beta-1,6-N-acetylglucosamine synthase-like glycosyltransferase
MVLGIRTRRAGALSYRSANIASGQAPLPGVTKVPAALAGSALDTGNDYPEIDCIRSLLPIDVLMAAQERAATLGIGADRVVIASGAMREEDYLRALARSLGVQFDTLECVSRTRCQIEDQRLIEAAAAGLLPLMEGDDLRLVVAPRGAAARRLTQLIKDNPEWARRLSFTSADHLNRFILRAAGQALAERASNALKQRWPELAAGSPRPPGHIVIAASIGVMALAIGTLAPAATLLTIEVSLATLFLSWLGLRLAGVFVAAPMLKPLPYVPPETLPTYSIIAALYREAASVDGLLRAIERRDYPPEKLDVILAVEVDDEETQAAIAKRTSRMPVTVVTVPAAGPRTKPKALNVALPFARGTFTVIYDAEDRPEPDQLRHALEGFRAGGERLACVQARLCIDNTDDSWLTRLFTAEYAAQFDVFLGGLAAFHLPLPLGGSSNHFRTAILRKIGAWDPYNVTEDADLGMRLARFGYRSGLIASTTYEEAPAALGPWLRQRTRWLKGWMQTWGVHMREPLRLKRELGLPGFLSVQLIVGGNVLAALVHPLFTAALIYAAMQDTSLWLPAIYGSSALCGYIASAALGWLGLARRGLLTKAWALLLTPLHWLLLSLAAWRALYQLIVSPYTWEKTTHGLAKSSRRADQTTRALLEFERHLRNLMASGNLPTLPADVTVKRPVRVYHLAQRAS